MRPGDPLVISCALTGGMTVPSQSAAIPVTVAEIVEAGVRAHEAGAAVLHVHVREPATGRPVADIDLFRKVIDSIRSQTDAIIQLTTGGAAGMSFDDRARVIPELKPEMATLNLGSINFAIHRVLRNESIQFAEWERQFLAGTKDNVFRNSFAEMERMCGLFRENGVTPEFEAYDVGHLYNLSYLLDEGLVTLPLHIQFVLGVLGGNAATLTQLLHMRATSAELFGDRFTWSVAGVGYPGEFQLAAAAMVTGGHVRVGLEDNLRITAAERAESNAALVEKAAQLSSLLDRVPASPRLARELLNMKS